MAALKAEEFIEKSRGKAILDIRTPEEFRLGHIPGAMSFPLFDNDERAVVGTIYKQKGKSPAVLAGLEFVGPKLKQYVVDASRMKGELFLYCWRGGMRSNSMAWLLETAGREVHLLEGGYKAYRAHGRDLMNAGLRLIMLSGPTGSGKTEILHKLEEMGQQVLDLEGLANHKGSSFGGLGQPEQPGTEHFFNLITDKIAGFDRSRPIWVEGESQNIGKVFIAEELFSQMNHCPAFRIDPPKEERMVRLMRDYACFPAEQLEAGVMRISKRLGGKATRETLDALHDGDYRKVADITLDYYDKTYEYSMSRRSNQIIPFAPESFDVEKIAIGLAGMAARMGNQADGPFQVE